MCFGNNLTGKKAERMISLDILNVVTLNGKRYCLKIEGKF